MTILRITFSDMRTFLPTYQSYVPIYVTLPAKMNPLSER